jgi:UDP-N-acetylmuramate: L-alanyl-gamma-D-glutamyl-meso-diaminopimelate ligase
VIGASTTPAEIIDSVERIVADLTQQLSGGEHVVIMSNGGFGGIHKKLVTALQQRFQQQ